MAKNLINALLGREGEGDDDDGAKSPKPSGPAGAPSDGAPDPGEKPRSLADAWDRIAEQNRRLEERLVALEARQRELNDTAHQIHETSKDQLKVLHLLGKFAESHERRGREMASQFNGIPDVLRTLPSATKEQAERLSEIAARLYEKAQDNTVAAIKAAQANHQRAVEDLIDKSLGATRRATYAAIATTAAAVALLLYVWLTGGVR